MDAVFVQGKPLMVDHRPTVAVAAGDVVVIGDAVRIAHSDIEADQLGALASGGGGYDVPKAVGGATAITDGTTLYWDDVNSLATATAGALKLLGEAIGDVGDDDATVRVQHIQ